MQWRLRVNSRASLATLFGAWPEGLAGARLLLEPLDAPWIFIFRRGLKFFWKVTMAVTKMAKFSPFMPARA
jgi:hypothetical protein